MSILSWFILTAIAVFDARENKIPNIYVLYFLLSVVIDLTLMDIRYQQFFQHVSCAGMIFALGLILYIGGVLAAGDVKLLSVIALLVGWQDILVTIQSIILSGGLFGLFYLLEKQSRSNHVISLSSWKLGFYQSVLTIQYGRKVTGIEMSKTYVPFAPAIVFGLAMSHVYL